MNYYMDTQIGIVEAAKIIGCNHSLIYFKIKKGEFPPYEIIAGRKIFYQGDIEEYAKNHFLRKDKRRKIDK